MFSKKIIKFNIWRRKHIQNYQLLIILSVLVGLFSGISAMIIKNAVHLIKELIHNNIPDSFTSYIYFIYPAIGILLAVLFMKYILKQKVGHGIPSVLYAISKNNGFIKIHNTFSSIITSAFTVGFGGSVGLEGPTVATGGAIGANFGGLFNLTHKERILLLGSASAAAMSAIFKSPIAGVVFALEVIMINLTTKSIVPILFASLTGYLTSFWFLGGSVLYSFTLKNVFIINDVPYYIFLGIFTGLIAVYFTRTYVFTNSIFDKIAKQRHKFLIGALSLGVLIFLFPSLYGEGYESINMSLKGDYDYLYENSFFSNWQDNIVVLSLLFLAIILLKVIAASLTFNAGGIGGIFAPTLFIGANAGLFLATVTNYLKITDIAANNSALVAMAGLIAGVLQAPLTGIFLISEITNGYGLFMPIMIVSGISYATVRIFEKNNVYSIQLAKRGELMTHHTDKNILMQMQIDELLETNFSKIKPNYTLGELVKVVAESDRNIYPVVDKNGIFLGSVLLNRIRKIMFKPKLYEQIKVSELMQYPDITIDKQDSIEDVAAKIQNSNKFNIVVLENGKYIGYISRANLFSHYRSMLREFSDY